MAKRRTSAWYAQRDATIVARIEGGATQAECGREFGLARERVRQIWRRYRKGAPPPKRGPRPGYRNPGTVARDARLYAAVVERGLTHGQAAAEEGMGRGSVRLALRRHERLHGLAHVDRRRGSPVSDRVVAYRAKGLGNAEICTLMGWPSATPQERGRVSHYLYTARKRKEKDDGRKTAP